LGRRRVAYCVSDVERWLAERTYTHRADELSRRKHPAKAGVWLDQAAAA
jgi:hypothetical protein